MKIKISIVTPSFNQGRFIERTIQSVLNQNIADAEYWVLDGGSTDDTVAILKKYSNELDWISEKDEGQADAVNKGISLTRGEIIGWLNSDDIYYFGAFQKILSCFDEHPEIDVIYGQAYHIDENDNIIENYPSEPWDIERLKDICFLSQPAVFFRRSVVERFGLLKKELNYCMDYEYWLRLGLAGAKFYYMQEILAGSRLYANTKTLGSRIKVHKEINDMMKNLLGTVPDRWICNYAHVFIEEKYQGKSTEVTRKRLVALHTMLSSLHWNKKISSGLLFLAFRWLTGSTKKKSLSANDRSLLIKNGGSSFKVSFDVSQTGTNKAGCGYFADNLIQAVAAIDLKNDYVLYPTFGDHFWDDKYKTVLKIQQKNFSQGSCDSSLLSAKQFWQNSSLDEIEKRLGNVDIIHANNFFCPPKLPHTKIVYTLYDLGFLQYPECTTEENRMACFSGVFRASLNADHIVAISQYTREHFLKIFPYYPAENISVIYPASRFQSKIVEIKKTAKIAHLQKDKFWLCVSTLEPRKNHKRLLEAYAMLKKQQKTFPLILAGGKGWMMEDLDETIRNLHLEQDVQLLGYVSEQELQWLYQHCFCMVYPSLFEGFGLPVLEAMTLGAVVISSTASSLPEVTGNAAILINPLDKEAIAAGMLKISTDENFRQNLKNQAKIQVQQFSWEKSARLLTDLYKNLTLFDKN